MVKKHTIRGPGIEVGDKVMRVSDYHKKSDIKFGKVLWVKFDHKTMVPTRALIGVDWQTGLVGTHYAKELMTYKRYMKQQALETKEKEKGRFKK